MQHTSAALDLFNPHTGAQTAPRALIADSQPGNNYLLAQVLGTAGVGVVSHSFTAEAWLTAVQHNSAELLVFEPAMPGAIRPLPLFERTRQLSRAGLVVYTSLDMPLVAEAFAKRGAAAVVSKCSGISALLRGIHAAKHGMTFMDPNIRAALARPHPWRALTDAERGIAEALITGATLKQIALGSQRHYNTVHALRTRALEKLNIRTEVELVRFAYEHGINHLIPTVTDFAPQR